MAAAGEGSFDTARLNAYLDRHAWGETPALISKED